MVRTHASTAPAVALAGLVFFLSLSGCLSGKPNALAPPNASIDGPQGRVDDANGAIEGVLTDDVLAPLPDVDVRILDSPNLHALSDAQGRFAFSLVAPGRHTLEFQKFGYLTARADVEVAAGQKATVYRSLATDVNAISEERFFHQPSPLRGTVKCAVGGLGAIGGTTLGLGKDQCSQVDKIVSNHDYPNIVRFSKAAGQNLTGLIVSVRWQPGSAVTGGRVLDVVGPVPLGRGVQNLRYCHGCWPHVDNGLRGESGFVAYYDSYDLHNPLVKPKTDTLSFTAFVANGNETQPDTWGGPMVEQPFTVAVLLLYNGMLPPEDYSLWGDG